jgi:hypothetical protein
MGSQRVDGPCIGRSDSGCGLLDISFSSRSTTRSYCLCLNYDIIGVSMKDVRANAFTWVGMMRRCISWGLKNDRRDQ